MSKRVVLAYSGGLDTSVAIGWIAAEAGAEVICVAADVGQGGEDMDKIRQRALDCGAAESVVLDLKTEFAEEYCLPALRANGLYLERYPLVSALSRPVIAKHLAQAANQYGADTVAHGCTGKGNDQVRFEVGIGAIAPELKVIAPVRDSGMTRDKAIQFAEDRGLPIDQSKRSPYSVDQNFWGRAVETGFLEDPSVERDLRRFKFSVEQRWTELVYDGLWFSPLRQALDQFVDASQQYVTGDIRMRLHGGRAVPTGRRGEGSLYDFDLATYDTGDTFDQSLAKGFVQLWGLPSRIAARRDLRASGATNDPKLAK